MKLLKFDVNNSSGTRSNKPQISFYRKGANVLSAAAVEMLVLMPGVKVAVFWDEETDEWYISTDKDGFPLRKSGPTSKALAFNCSKVANLILDAAGLQNEPNGWMRIATEPIIEQKKKFYCIIVSSAETRKKEDAGDE